MIDFFTSIDTLLFGRLTYELMASFWLTPAAATEDQTIARYMNDLPKIVFSRTLSAVRWMPCTLVKEDIGETMLQLKKQPGKDMVIFGGANIISTFVKLNLIDEFRLIVNPVILRKGTPLFKHIQQTLRLQFMKS
jgi:dihydrofolate reductase